MEIMRVSDSDFAMAVKVYKKSWQESHEDICSPEFLKRRDYSGYLEKRKDSLYVIVDAECVGVFSLKEGTFGDLYIHPEHWGKGYGTACVRYALQRNPDLRLTVLSTNKTAIGLYQKMGFRFTGNDIPLRNGLYEREMLFINNV